MQTSAANGLEPIQFKTSLQVLKNRCYIISKIESLVQYLNSEQVQKDSFIRIRSSPVFLETWPGSSAEGLDRQRLWHTPRASTHDHLGQGIPSAPTPGIRVLFTSSPRRDTREDAVMSFPNARGFYQHAGRGLTLFRTLLHERQSIYLTSSREEPERGQR